MAKEKIYKCCICHKSMKENKPIRLVKQIYGLEGRNQYYNVGLYDFCERCFRPFEKYIDKYKEE